MDTVALSRPFHGAMWATKSSISVSKNATKNIQFSRLAMSRKESFLPQIKSSDASSVLTSKVSSNETTDLEPKSTFPTGVEAMLRDICDETTVAEVKLKVGNFEMYLKRDIDSSSSPVTPSSPVHASSPVAPAPAAPARTHVPELETSIGSSTGERNPFMNPSDADVKLAFINQGHGSTTYEVVTAPTVGIFQRARVVKGMKRPPACKEGSTIKEGSLIGFIKQFNTSQPVRSTVAGEVIRFLYKDEEPVGFGDPLVAVLPSFHGNEIGL